ncbi:ferrochelatase [Aurantimicrobium minutum]|uniref:ferrochelatase n=1 Tax=Aurantimicrobium minutum TaxID=708131 RepID=UPI002476AB0F|nr:ferrochelatase [Aurantimicrobium minutum]MDH6532478.1 ferrochelatase [Aurantimicrobium minutum]
MSYDAILLTSFGGPEGPDEVMPFLERVTAGRGIPRERLEEVSHHYMALGGISPINDQNRALLNKMRDIFPRKGIDIPIYWANRNSEPFFADVISQMYEDGHRTVLAWVTSAYSSYSGCRQYRENLYQALADNELVGKMRIDKVRHYFDHPGFLTPFMTATADAVAEITSEGIPVTDIAVLFTTHSIPDGMGETSGPPARRQEFAQPGGAYAAQHLAAAKLIMEDVQKSVETEGLNWQLVYQSRSGSPAMPWLEPDINDAIAEVANLGSRAVVVVPLGFVSDHVEVIWDLDNEAAETASDLGLRFKRVATPGDHDIFVEGIAELINERIANAKPQALSSLGPWADRCAVGCCPNLRRELPVVAEETTSY